MPSSKSRLTRSEQAEYLAAAQQLLSQGVALELPEAWRDQATGVDISIGTTSSIYILAPGQVVYALYARLTSNMSHLSLTAFDILVDWEEAICCQQDLPPYEFGPRGSLPFDTDEVLNHRISHMLHFKRKGDRHEGYLLGTGLRPVPSQYGPGKPAPLTLRLFDSAGRAFESKHDIAVDRTAKVPDWFRDCEGVPNRRRTAKPEELAASTSLKDEPKPLPKEVQLKTRTADRRKGVIR